MHKAPFLLPVFRPLSLSLSRCCTFAFRREEEIDFVLFCLHHSVQVRFSLASVCVCVFFFFL